MPRVSVGLPVYNGAQYLAEAIRSILTQTWGDLELIISDNASTDGTPEICSTYARDDSRIRYYRTEKNVGASANFNRVFELCEGEYFKWAAHDDVCEPDFLEECIQVLDSDPSVVLCHSDVDWIDANGEFLHAYDPDLDEISSDRPSARFRNLITSRHFCIDVFGLIRSSVLQDTPRIASYIGSDRNLLAELGLQGRFHRVRRVLFHSREHAGRSIRSMSPWDRAGWFDPALAGEIVLPHWRNLREYAASVGRVHLEFSERLGCYLALAAWMGYMKRPLWIDLKVALKGHVRKWALRPQAKESRSSKADET